MRKVAQFLFIFTVTFLLATAAFTATVKKKPLVRKQLTLPCWYGLVLPPPKEGGRPVCGRMVYWI